MLRRVLKVVGVAFACLLVALVTLVVVSMQFATSSAGGTLDTGRVVMASAKSWYISAEYQRDTATIRTAGHTIVVAPTELLVDGKSLTAIDRKISSVEVTVGEREISFVADGREVARSRR
jgi:hypothetical protein